MSDHNVMDSEGPWPAGWLWALAAAVVAAILARWLGGVSVAAAILVALLVFGVFGVLLAQFWEAPASGDHDAAHGHGAASGDRDAHGHAPDRDAHGHAPDVAPMSSAPLSAKAHPVVVEAKAPAPMVASPSAAAASEFAASVATAPQASMPDPASTVAIQTTASGPVAAEPVASGPVAVEPVMAHPVVAQPVRAQPVSDTCKPLGLTGPRGGIADALQEIDGIGPALEKLAHDMGIHRFDHIAGWGAAEIARMDANLEGFKWRVTWDNWVAQARIIAAEGVDAFRLRAKSKIY